MLKKSRFFCLWLLIAACVDPYDFVVHDNERGLVVEAYISDRSYNETLMYPSDGRYFSVKLTWTSDVDNTRSEPVPGAHVELLSSDGNVWTYSEDTTGVFLLMDNDFKAQPGLSYKVRIVLPEEDVYESEWEALPAVSTPEMGDPGFAETERQIYVMEANEWVLKTIKGVTTNIYVNENDTKQIIHYRWIFAPMWIYKAPLSSVVDPGHICWATDENHLNTFALQTDLAGGYRKDLFFFQTIRNERIFESFSVLITQHVMTDRYFNFWKEMKDRNEGSALNGIPPYNLQTNYSSVNGDKHVFGFFGVVQEQARRWYFSTEDLSYHVVNTLKADCLVDYGPGPPAEECTDCRAYSFGKATTIRPSWWQQ